MVQKRISNSQNSPTFYSRMVQFRLDVESVKGNQKGIF
jgi:hypothetical protein